MTDAFGLDQPLYVGDTRDGEPVWVRKELAWCFDQDSAVLVSLRLDQVMLEPEDPTEPNWPLLRMKLGVFA
jgi:hypothetical protein